MAIDEAHAPADPGGMGKQPTRLPAGPLVEFACLSYNSWCLGP